MSFSSQKLTNGATTAYQLSMGKSLSIKTLRDSGLSERAIAESLGRGAVRSKDFSAIGPSAAGARGLTRVKDAKQLPVLHVAGEKDEVVPFANQQKTVEAIRKLNGCEAEGKLWAKAGDLVGTVYESKHGHSVVWVVHPGTHKYPGNAPELIVRFFKAQTRSKLEKAKGSRNQRGQDYLIDN